MLSPFKLLPFLEAGCDEAGRGCLAGPVTCASVLLPEFSSRFVDADSGMGFLTTNLDDSKQLSEKKRELLRPIIENTCVSFAVCHIFPNEIDNINILQASILGMQKAALKLCPLPKLILVDGNQFNNGKYLPKGKNNIFRIFNQAEFDIMSSSEVKKKHIFYETIIKGDAKYQSVAAASVLAKSYRDDYMNKIDKEFPMYNWKQNKGYPTKEHREAIAKHGLTKYHRKTFKCSI